jgi:hypothetical protein
VSAVTGRTTPHKRLLSGTRLAIRSALNADYSSSDWVLLKRPACGGPEVQWHLGRGRLGESQERNCAFTTIYARRQGGMGIAQPQAPDNAFVRVDRGSGGEIVRLQVMRQKSELAPLGCVTARAAVGEQIRHARHAHYNPLPGYTNTTHDVRCSRDDLVSARSYWKDSVTLFFLLSRWAPCSPLLPSIHPQTSTLLLADGIRV